MQKIGIIFAMKEELDEVLKLAEIKSQKKIYELTFYDTIIKNKNCILVECGVGKVNAARCTQILIDLEYVDCIFNVGVAGGVSNSLKVGDIVIGEKLVQHDFDITAFEHEKGYIPNVGIFINSDKQLLKIANESINLIDTRVLNGTIASGDIFCTEDNMSKKINSKFDALCVDMEGASIAQVAYLCDVPFLIIRSISDIPNNDNVITYEEFLESSCQIIAKFLLAILEKIEK